MNIPYSFAAARVARGLKPKKSLSQPPEALARFGFLRACGRSGGN
ncbi:hypothetical protein [Salinisphaera sp.]|nr:hypothetical protein [Salinisphaera sp.]HET7315397.1 hypothetical protein [Salinisphaera sp.]